ncbi:ArsB/NhaD family transporter [Paenibacillus sacheonensis]|uniref:Arsenical efflux pump membrane protein ArsB n=1 Tax=Paenibacillus sacheonensis TaxID=742054 RepID=A0A7X4YR74_9BACL|nr:ArsB/NhaD family transporter [Paenibacillus sacheonensis]MBM7563668.1 arsenical pump membrane protein [Paenibacillus sacheonensis]NBC71038.1 arsenical efflux pump membrane protein ArsB [Paenibacillus sacheonensis]
MAMLVAVGVFFASLALIIWKPKGLHEALTALAGAALLFAARLLAPGDAAYIWHFVWNATFSLIGIMLFTSLLDANGFFRWAALHIVRQFYHRQLRLLVGLCALAACITVFFNNDGTILIMIPIVLEVTALLQLPRRTRLAFLLGIGLMADTASAPLMMSNLTNILTADFFGLTFGEYARTMLFPGLTAIVATIAITALFFGSSIRLGEKREEAPRIFPEPASAVSNKKLFKLSWLIIAMMMAGYLLSGKIGLPVAFIALGGAAVQWAASFAVGMGNVRATIRRTPWSIVVFALSMNLIVYGLYLHGAVDWFPKALGPMTEQGAFLGILGSGGLFSLLSAAVNNLPAVLVSSLAIQDTGGPHYLPFASLLGTSVGAKLTPIGSLATLLWLQLLRKGGIEMSWREYMKYGIVLTVPILVCALLALWLTIG